MRISGGECKGRRLRAPKSGLRPTQDQVREALFSMLADRLPECRFLDLYAGSGAVGLEALSRGAARVCWVESHAGTLRVLKTNIAELGLSGGQPVKGDVLRVDLSRLPGAPFDVIFADPPYATPQCAEEGGYAPDPSLVTLMERIERGATLASDGYLILEQAKRSGVIAREGWSLLRDRTYGMARILVYSYQPA